MLLCEYNVYTVDSGKLKYLRFHIELREIEPNVVFIHEFTVYILRSKIIMLDKYLNSAGHISLPTFTKIMTPYSKETNEKNVYRFRD